MKLSACLALALVGALGAPLAFALPKKTVSNVTVGNGAFLDVVNLGEIDTSGAVVVQGTGEAVFWTNSKISLKPGFRATPTGSGWFLAAVDTNWNGYTDIEESEDSDGDGIFDAWEIRYGLNPNLAADAGYDSDGDGMTNLNEFLAGRSPIESDITQPLPPGLGLILVVKGSSPATLGVNTSTWQIAAL